MAVKLKGPEDHGGFSFRGESFTPDESGHIEVPHEALLEAFDHGFSIVTDADDADGNETGNPDLSKMKKADLLAFAKANLDLELDECKTNKELIAAIEEAMEAA